VKITAKDIARWAELREAQGSLPRLVRRLAMQSGTITQLAFPAGESVSLPGWDGEILSSDGDAWVPKGKSCWELSVEANPTPKANRDYDKRTNETPETVRRSTTLVIVTARRWSKKNAWRDEKLALCEWHSIRAYDADDLDAWLEANPAIALDFADELGLTGDGVESASHYWQVWATQSVPPILKHTFFADRQDAKDRLLVHLRERIDKGDNKIYAIRADSVDEAAAFVCAALLDASDLLDTALVVTSDGGWRFVEKQPRIKLVVAARPEVATRVPGSSALVVVPVAAGDLVSGYGGQDGTKFDLVLERPGIYSFRDALIENGIEESDAQRLARATGRSWTVLRRRLAANPAIRRPGWLAMSESDALSTLCLLGAWNTEKAADRAVVERLSGVPYENIERKLRILSRADDPPVLSIGKVWHTKAPLELLDLFAERITSAELNRFFDIVESLLVEPDPQLELPEDQRWMAQVHGKVRAESGLLFESVCDTLVKLAVRGPDYPALAAQSIDLRVANLVHRLLDGADGTRWLSLASHLRPIAEAAPDVFLKAIEASLNCPGAPVTRLITESSNSGSIGSRCWRADLLWALEVLAWPPRHLTRVVLILARLARVPITDNWSNTPLRTLIDIFRAWIPQTAATLEQRIVALDLLIQTDADIGFNILDQLIHNGPDFASPSATPVWRDDNAGAGGQVSFNECRDMLIAAADRLVALSERHAGRLARLLDKLNTLDPDRANQVLSMVAAFAEADVNDEDRALLRSALREKLHWHLNYDKSEPHAIAEKTGPWQQLYDALSPADPVIRHRWLFRNAWADLPVAIRGDHKLKDRLREQWRKSALDETYQHLGMVGVERLALSCGDPFTVGRCLLATVSDNEVLADWIIQNSGDFISDSPLTSVVCGIVRFMVPEFTGEFIRDIVTTGLEREWTVARLAGFLQLARDERLTWNIVDECGSAVQAAYWNNVNPSLFQLSTEEWDFVLIKLLDAGRPRTALRACQHNLNGVSPALLADAMQKLVDGLESNAPMPDSWDVGEIFERLESWEGMDRERLIQMEFQFVPAFHLDGETKLKVLYAAVTSRPEIFAELICLVYRPEGVERNEEPPNEGKRLAAESAWNILHHCRRQPGTRLDGSLDAAECVRFIEEARELCRQHDRSTLGDQTLGQILAHAPIGDDRVWPGLPARDILNRPELEQMRVGFRIGTSNKRGVTTRSLCEGGKQERTLAQYYRQNADALATTHPYLAASMEELAQQYEYQAMREDNEAGLRRERY
jgi:hypothetical protein